MKFSYTKIPTRDLRRAWASRPLVSVRLHGPTGIVLVDALLDSGADSCVFDASIGKAIGAVPKGSLPTTFRGIGNGHLQGWAHAVRIEILGAQDQIEVMAGFTEGLGISAILGQEGFFDHYKITFERQKNRFELI